MAEPPFLYLNDMDTANARIIAELQLLDNENEVAIQTTLLFTEGFDARIQAEAMRNARVLRWFIEALELREEVEVAAAEEERERNANGNGMQADVGLDVEELGVNVDEAQVDVGLAAEE